MQNQQFQPTYSSSDIQQQQQQLQYAIKDEKIPQSKKYANQRKDKEFQISINLIAETSLDNKITSTLSQEQKIQLVLELKSIHLQWLNIKNIANLQVFEKLSVLYLQHNQIKRIQGLECLRNLEYLALNNNMISKVQNLKHLSKLQGLNLNHNQIEELNCTQLPKNLHLLSLVSNPVTLDANYKKDILKALKNLEVLDDTVITPLQRMKAIGKIPQNIINYASQMNHFYRKQEIKKKLSEKQKPILLGGDNIDEKQILDEIRKKTVNYLNQNQDTFMTEKQDQDEDFDLKIKVSRNIRNIKEQQEKSRKDRLEEIKLKKLQEIDRQIGQIKQIARNQSYQTKKQAIQKNNSQEIATATTAATAIAVDQKEKHKTLETQIQQTN